MNESIPDYKTLPRSGRGLYYDPLYGYIPLHSIIREALDLPPMQRLRNIKQLSTVDLVFPGATHNRFVHSVGVCYLAGRVFDTLFYNHSDPPVPLNGTVKLALELAALFHDVGHGPGSHVFEAFCNRNPDFRELNHVKMSERLIRDGVRQYTHIKGFLNDVHQLNKASPSAELLTPESIASIAVGNAPPCDERYAFLGQIVASDYDVDKMDYLRRDAFYTGVATGWVDIWELIHNYVIYPVKTTGASEIWNAGISVSAAPALENLLLARDLAYRRVYYQTNHRVAQEMLLLAIQQLSKKVDSEELALYCDHELLDALEKDADSPFAKDVARRLRYRKLYEPLPLEISMARHLSSSARTSLAKLVTPKTLGERTQHIEELRGFSTETLSMPEVWRVIFDFSETPLTKREAFTSPYLYDKSDGSLSRLIELLPHLRLTHGEEEYREYKEETSKLLIALPPEFLLDCVDRVSKQQKKDGKVSGGIGETEAIKKVYEESLKPIIDKFISVLGFMEGDEERLVLAGEFEAATTSLLSRLVGREKPAE